MFINSRGVWEIFPKAVVQNNQNRSMIMPVAIVGLLGLAMRLWGLTKQSLWVDEMFSLKYAQIHGSLSWDALRSNLHGPLHAAFLHVWCTIFGWGEFAMRLPEALISAATVPLLFVAARPAFGINRALAGSLLLAINPFHIWYAQEVRNYSLLVFFTVLAIIALQRLDSDGRLRRSIPLAICWIAGLLSNLSMLFHMVGALIWGLVRFRKRTAVLLGLILAAVLSVIALLPWEIEFYRGQLADSHALSLNAVPEGERLRGKSTAPMLAIPYAIYAFSAGFSLGPSLRELRRSPSLETVAKHPVPIAAVAVAFGTLAIAGLIGWIGGDSHRRLWLTLLLIPIALLFIAATRNVKVFNARYVSVALPAYLMLVADGAGRLGRARIGAILFIVVVLLSAVSVYQMQAEPRYWREDARSAAEVLKAEVDPGDLILVVGTLDPIERYYWYGLTERQEILRHTLPWWVGPEEGEHKQKSEEAIASAKETYVLFYRDDHVDPDRKWETYLRNSYEILKTWEFPGVRIWRLGEGGAP